MPIAILSKANIDKIIITGTQKNPLKIIIGKPFSINQKSYEDRYEIADRTRTEVLALMKGASL